MIALILAASAALFVAGSAIIYTRPHVAAMMLISAANGALFAWGAKVIGDRERILVFSLWMDVIMALAYYVLPLLAFGVKPSPALLVGCAIVVVGLGVIHAAG